MAKRSSRSTFLLGGAGILSLTAAASAARGPVVISGIRLIDGTGAPPVDDAVLVLKGNRIAAAGARTSISIPTAARTIVLSRKTVIPALIDAHAHVGLLTGNVISTKHYSLTSVQRDLRLFASGGVLAVQVMGTDHELAYNVRQAQAAGYSGEARLFTAGRGFGAPGGIPGPGIAQWVYRPKTAEEARANVRALALSRPDLVKLWCDDNFGRVVKMTPEVSSAIIDEAHQQGLRVAAHLFYLADAKQLVAAGVDIIAHSVRDREIDAELLDAMKARGTLYIPTLTLDESKYIYADRPAYMNETLFRRVLASGVFAYLRSNAYRNAVQSDKEMQRWRAAAMMGKRNAAIVSRAGIPVLVGTDSGAAVERIIGFDTHKELALLVEAGFTPLQAIRAATELNARWLGPRAHELGALTPGKRANFLVLDGDPIVAIGNTRRISQIWYDGVLARGAPVAELHDPRAPVVPAADVFSSHSGVRSACGC